MCEFISASGVVEARTLSAPLVEGLATGRLLAVRIPDYCDFETCRHLLASIADIAGVGYVDEESFKKKIGGAVYDAAHDPNQLNDHFDRTPEWFAACREAFSPYQSPSDKIRLELQEQWPHGFDLQHFHGHIAFVGLIRSMGVGAEALAHQDMTEWDIPHIAEAHGFEAQLSCVTYFEVAEEGGELELWNFGFTDQEEYNRNKTRQDHYSLDRGRIGEPAATLTPRVGELIVFNAKRIHAVRAIKKGVRTSQSLFIGYRGNNRQLSGFC